MFYTTKICPKCGGQGKPKAKRVYKSNGEFVKMKAKCENCSYKSKSFTWKVTYGYDYEKTARKAVKEWDRGIKEK